MVEFFHDNAMFYKDITQWLRNRTFGSLFFGLLLVAEALSLFIIGNSDEMNQPGVVMFYMLYMVLAVYALLIAYLGNGLTSREFVNRTFELYELSGMSLERMVGGKLLSMLYQFFFGFFCLVPFMFFAYFLGGLDFFEMLVGVALAALVAVPLYLLSLTSALLGRYKQVSVLLKLGSGFLMGIAILMGVISVFSNDPVFREIIRGATELMKRLLGGDRDVIMGLLFFLIIYVQVCLLMFYFCCNCISRETDSREIPIKILVTTLLLSWILSYGYALQFTGFARGSMYRMMVPIFLGLLGLGLVTYYNRLSVPPIVARRYRDAGPFRRALYWLFQPGMRGGIRTLLFLIGLVLVVGTGILSFGGGAVGSMPTASSSSGFSLTPYRGTLSASAFDEWWNAASLVIQIPWFLTFPYLLLVRGRNLRFNYPGQRALIMSIWVLSGVLVTIYMAWSRAGFYTRGSGSSSSFSDVLISTLLSPLPSMGAIDTGDMTLMQTGGLVRMASGGLGAVLMVRHLFSIRREDEQLSVEAEHATQEGTVISENSARDDVAERAEQNRVKE